MKREAALFFGGLLLAVTALPADGTARKVTSDWAHAREQYSPPILANGDLGTLVDYRNMMFQDVPSYAHIRAVGNKYRPSIYRQGRRTDDRRLACLGRIEETVETASGGAAVPDRWMQELDITRAFSRVENGFGATTICSEAFIHAEMPVLALSKTFRGAPLKRYAFEYLLAKPDSRDELPLHTRVKPAPDGFAFEIEKAKQSIHGAIAVVTDAPGAHIKVSGNKVTVSIEQPFADVHFYVAFADDVGNNDHRAQMNELKARLAAGWTSTLASHAAAWQTFWGDTFVSIPDKRIEDTYYTALYNLKCWSTAWSIPVGILPMHWNGTFFGFTFFNPALCASGHPAEARKVAQYRRDTLDCARFRAGGRRTTADGRSSGARYAWQSLEDGAEGTLMEGRWLDHILHLCNIPREAWTCWLYSNDKKYLKDTAYPVLRECAEFFRNQAIYELKDGRTVIGKVCDLERLPMPLENALLTTTGAMMTLNCAAEAAALLGVDDADAADWRRLSAELGTHLPNDGVKYLPYPRAKERSIGALSGIFPYGSVGPEDALQKAAVYDFERNGLATGNMYTVGKGICSWYAAWLAAAQCAYGDGEGAWRNLRRATASVGRFSEIFEINEPEYMSVPWCSSPQGTYIEAVHRMLLQCDADTITIAPAVPAQWKQYAFALDAYDNIRVTARFQNGRATEVTLRGGANTSGREKTVALPGVEPRRVKVRAGDHVKV